MKYKFEIEGDFFEDREEMELMIHSRDLYCKITDADNAIRNRLKHHDNLSDDERLFLEKLREALYIRYLD
jgi:hypothetical protein